MRLIEITVVSALLLAAGYVMLLAVEKFVGRRR